MTDEQRQEFMRRYNENMRPMSEAQMAILAAEQAKGMQQAVFPSQGQQDAMRNFWGRTDDPGACFIPDTPPPTLWARFNRWIRA